MHTRLYCATWLIFSLAACLATSESEASEANDNAVTHSALHRRSNCHTPVQPPAAPPAPSACLFGEVFSDIRSNPALQIDAEIRIRAVDTMSPLAGEQLLRAVQQSSHTDVTTPAQALARVDQQEVRRIDFRERESGRAYVVFEYGVGDNSYGAFFELESAQVVAAIHDGDLLDCQATAAAAVP